MLPPETGRALLYAAAAGPGASVAALMTALDTDDLAVWAPAEASGLVSLVEDRLVFRHPLARSAAFLRHPAGERHQAHLDLAGAATQPEVRARHLAAATVGTSESVAAVVEDCAWRRGDAVGAARALEQAARLSPQRRERARRLTEALVAAHMVGDPGWVRDLHGRFVQDSTDPELACLAAAALASALSQESFQQEAFDVLANVSEHFSAVGRPVALALASLAAGIAVQSGLPEHKAALSTLIDRARAADRAEQRRALVTGPLGRLDTPEAQQALDAFVTVVIRPQAAARLLPSLGRPHTALPDTPDALACRMALASVAYHADEADVCLGQLRKADTHLRTARAFGIRAWSLLALLDTLVNTGRFTEAEILIREATAEAAVLRLPRLQADVEAQALTLQALRGAVPTEPWLTPSIWYAVSLDENRATHARLLRARGLASLALGTRTGLAAPARVVHGRRIAAAPLPVVPEHRRTRGRSPTDRPIGRGPADSGARPGGAGGAPEHQDDAAPAPCHRPGRPGLRRRAALPPRPGQPRGGPLAVGTRPRSPQLRHLAAPLPPDTRGASAADHRAGNRRTPRRSGLRRSRRPRAARQRGGTHPRRPGRAGAVDGTAAPNRPDGRTRPFES
ncbi:hypothetical protein SAZ11_03995 [Streptomyces sp. FXJ1.4098]|nr:hypothetical protein [Streptomyces sp. FXJ1.4098]